MIAHIVSLIGLAVSLLLGEVQISPSNRVHNGTGSQCVWATLETIGRHYGLSQLYDLTARHKGTSGPGEVNHVLKAKGLQTWYWRPEGKKDIQSIRNAVAHDWPVAVGISGVHMLLVTDINDESVAIIDNSDPSLKVQRWSLQSFERRWDGWFIVIPAPTSDKMNWSTVLWPPLE